MPPREQEPRVVTADVQAILRRVIRPDAEDEGESVALIAEKADTSTRTVYRVLSRTTDSISLDLADRLVLAAEAQLFECRLVFADGTVQKYLD